MSGMVSLLGKQLTAVERERERGEHLDFCLTS